MPFVIILFGTLAASFALIIELLIMNLFALPFTLEGAFSFKIVLSFLLLALIEEGSKYLFLLRYRKYAPDKNAFTFSTSLLTAILFGIGFSSLEIIFASQNLVVASLFPIVRTLLLHISTSLFLIYFLFSRWQQEHSFALKGFGILSSAILLHLMYNIFVFLTI